MNQLSPSQTAAFDTLRAALPFGHVFTLHGDGGLGRTTVLRELHAQLGGRLIDMRDFLDLLATRDPAAIEETFGQLILGALAEHDTVLVDDLQSLTDVVAGCGSYPRSGLIDIPLAAASRFACDQHKKLIVATTYSAPQSIANRAFRATIDSFGVDDYIHFARINLAEDVASRLDFGKIHRYAGDLDAHQLLRASRWLSRESDSLSTERVIEFLKSEFLVSNVDLDEVQPVRLSDLRGVDDIVASLEANVVLPLENDALATEFRLRPKRGVLLAGPPGTGKTTVGRALAHRLKSKFFLLDGTYIVGTDHFYHRVQWLFHQAMEQSPCVLFIDDADVLFENHTEPGLYRYLLTLLDGLESKTAGQVCVMLTAMDVAGLPPALVRSGRVELWLEMRLPDAAARREILAPLIAGLPDPFPDVDLARVAAAAEGFTGADLKRMTEDAKIQFAAEHVAGKVSRTITDHFLAAADGVRHNRRLYAEAERLSRLRRQPASDCGPAVE